MKKSKIADAWNKLAISEETENRILGKIEQKLQSQRKFPVLKLKLKPAFIAAIVIIILVTTIAASAPMILKMLGGNIDFFNTDIQTHYSADQELIKQYSSEVGVTAERNGFSFTVDNAAFDGIFMNVFYTLKSETPLDEEAKKNTTIFHRIELAIPGYTLLPNKYGSLMNDHYFVSDNEIKGVQRFIITDNLPDMFNIQVQCWYYYEFPEGTKTPLNIELTVDMSESKINIIKATPNISAIITQKNVNYIEGLQHDITIDKVSVSPLGNILVITEKGGTDPLNWELFGNYFIVDDKGNFYGQAGFFIDGRKNWEDDITYYIEFCGNVPSDVQYFKLIPYNFEPIGEIIPYDEDYSKSKAYISDLPQICEQSEYGNVLIQSCVVTDEDITVTYKYMGMVKAPFITITDGDQNTFPLSFTNAVYSLNTDSYTLVYKIREPIENIRDAAKMIKVIRYDIELLEEQTIIIPMQ